ncbi:MAG TPA: hypothetical protein VIL37_13435 [Natronosporangium sp.]
MLLGQDLLLRRGDDADPARPLSAEEATRLATMRQHNWQDARAGVRATIGTGAEQVHLAGWVDWRRPMVYLARSGPTPGEIAELIQAVPGLIAVRPGEPAPAEPTPEPEPTGSPGAGTDPSAGPELIDPYPKPPATPPADGWRLRQPGADGAPGAPAAAGTIDALAVLLLTIAAEEPDAAELLAETESQWLREDRTAGYEVDVLLGPAILPGAPLPGPPAPGSQPPETLAALGGAVQYWLDRDARLHRLDALLATDTPVRVDLDRADQTTPAVLDLLGGAAIDPAPVTDQQAEQLAQLRQRNRGAGGGEVRITVPTEQGDDTITATGYLDWQRTVAYLVVHRPNGSSLVWADGSGVSTRSAGSLDDLTEPPLPAPTDGWSRTPWEGRGDDQGGYDLDLLLNEALSLSGWELDDADHLRQTAHRLRGDRLDGVAVSVYEIPRPIESEVEPGGARMRYWVDDESGVLRRLEIRTRSGGFGQLDLSPGQVPWL